jgi:trans-L-3-hydroxyproline dehydratase
MKKEWSPPEDWIKITTIDAHTEGEPLRLITSGFPALPGKTILEKRRWMQQKYDQLRKALIWEPRGHTDMYGCIVTEPVTQDGTVGVIFFHNEGYSTMCGHGIIALSTILIETGRLEAKGTTTELKIDTPAGRVMSTVHRVEGKVSKVSFVNVPSFVYATEQQLDVPGIGRVTYDIAFGGAFYAFCRAEELGLRLNPEDNRKLIDAGLRIKNAIAAESEIRHPFEEDLSFLYGTIFTGPAQDPGHHSRNVCVFAEGEIDRSPTGTGVSARAALHYARGEINIDQPFVVESILGTCFTGRIVDTTPFGPHAAVIPEITGTAHITGRNEFLIDPADPLKYGFFLR